MDRSTASTLADTAALILLSEPLRVKCLEAVRNLKLNDAWIAAGFVRNAIWDYCHGCTTPTPLNDVDVVYFDPADISAKRDEKLRLALSEQLPDIQWDVKNQARMHQKHGHAAYRNTEDAIRRWVEVPTCTAAALDDDGRVRLLAPFGLQHNFSLRVDINPLFPRPDVFQRRITEKQWLRLWPRLKFKTGTLPQ